MKRSWSVGVCLALAVTLLALLRWNAAGLESWIVRPKGAALLSIFAGLPYVLFTLAAMWAARIANTPVYVLSLLVMPAHFYFSGGTLFGAGADQMKMVLFMMVPIYVTVVSFLSHRTVACSLVCGIVAILTGILAPLILSAVCGRTLLQWIGEFRWSAAGILGVPSTPTLYYATAFVFNLILPFGGKEGEMKKILAAILPCYYFSGVFRPLYEGGPLLPPAIEPVAFVTFSALAALYVLYANFFLSWSKAYVDDLTQVMGRRALNETVAHLNGVYAIAMVDVDHFKKFNDTYGHAAGDVVLKTVASILNENSGGRVYRYGGEEFSIVFQNVDAETAASQMDDVRQLLADTKISLNGAVQKKRDKKVTVHISAGVSESTPKTSSPEDVLHSADKALYQAKEKGRNRVEIG